VGRYEILVAVAVTDRAMETEGAITIPLAVDRRIALTAPEG
jgi:hypothetical protein